MFANLLNTLSNCFKIPELKSRILFTVLLLGVARIAAMIPIPGLNGEALYNFFENRRAQGGDEGLLGMYSLFTGGALEKCAIGSLGIMPYISATIIIQLLTAVIPTLSKLAREDGGRTKIVQYGRYLTVILCLIQGGAMAFGWLNPQTLFPGFDQKLVLIGPTWWYILQTTLVLTTCTLLLMWLGEQITERGIGNGVSLIITVGILARMPKAMQSAYRMFFPPAGTESSFHLFHGIALVLLLLGVIAAVIAVTQAQRKIPVQYAQRAVGRKVYAGGSSFMPLKVNYAGVMPIIFAQAILMFPQKLLEILGKSLDIPFLFQLGGKLNYGSAYYVVLEALMILFFSYFWVATQFNEVQIADDLKKYNGYIPGVRPGLATSDFLHNAMSRITLAGAVFLAGLAIIPMLLYSFMRVPLEVGSFFGGTSVLISVGVVLDTMRQIESHLLMRHYDGFLKKGRIKGRF